MRLPSRHFLARRAVLSCVLLCVLPCFIAGCENSIAPQRQDVGFSIYGTLSLNSTRQIVRVRDLTAPFTAEATDTLDAAVMFVDVETDERLPMRDSVVTFDGMRTHNFWVDRSLRPNARYRIVAERSDGLRAVAQTRTPSTEPPRLSPALPSCILMYALDVPDTLDDLSRVRMRIGFRYRNIETWVAPPIGQYDRLANGTIRLRFRPETLLSIRVPENDNPRTVPYESRCLLLDDPFLSVAYVYLGDGGRLGDGYNPARGGAVAGGRGELGVLWRDTLTVRVVPEG